jgi:hypothetical protein
MGFTPYTGEIVNTFFRYEGMGCGFDAPFIPIEEAKIVVHEADEPYLIVDFADTDALACKHFAEVDFALADADAAAGWRFSANYRREGAVQRDCSRR